MGDAIEALQELCGDLADTLKQITDITAELAARDHIRVENIEEVSMLPKPFGDIDELMLRHYSLACQPSRSRYPRRLQHWPKTAAYLSGVGASAKRVPERR